jgi:hypothetical protein
MSEPRTRRRGTWWVVAGLLVTFAALAVRVGLPVYRRKQAIEAIERIGGIVEFAAVPKYPGVPERWLRALSRVNYIGTWPSPFEGGFAVSAFFRFGDCDEQSRQRARELARNLSGFNELTSLNLRYACLDDEALSVLVGLRKLEILDLSQTEIDDDGLRYVADLNELRSLGLDHTNVSNEGMQFIVRLPKLRELSVSNTAVTDLGLLELRMRHPDLLITDD